MFFTFFYRKNQGKTESHMSKTTHKQDSLFFLHTSYIPAYEYILWYIHHKSMLCKDGCIN